MKEITLDKPKIVEKVNVHELIMKRFDQEGGIALREVRNAAGFNADRALDYVIVGTWPSRGLTITGIECKAHRSDWIKELKNPAKADAFYKYCDYFYLVTENDKVADISEIPDAWGWLCVEGKKLVCKKSAPKNEITTLNRGFVISMLKRAYDRTGWIQTKDVQEHISKQVEFNTKDIQYKLKEQDNTIEHLRQETKNYQDKIKEFVKETGIPFDWYGYYRRFEPHLMGKAVRQILDGKLNENMKMYDKMEKDMSSMLSELQRMKAECEQINQQLNDTNKESIGTM